MRWPRLLTLAGIHGAVGTAAAVLVAVGCWSWSPCRETWAMQFRSGFAGPQWHRTFPVSSELGEEQPDPEPYFTCLDTYGVTPQVDWSAEHVSATRVLWLITGVGVTHSKLETTVETGAGSFAISSICIIRIGWPMAILDGVAREGPAGTEVRTGYLATRNPARPWIPVRPIFPNIVLVAGILSAASFGLTLTGGAAVRLLRRSLLRRRHHCPTCNYDRRGLAPGAPCPECGAGGPA